MKYLIDTHVLLCMCGDDKNLFSKTKEILRDKSFFIYISLMSFWEIAIKHSIGKLQLEVSINELFQFTIENKIEVLPVIFNDFEIVDKLPFPKNNGVEHRDPFDRIIIAQSITNELQIISCDDKFDFYQNIKRIW